MYYYNNADESFPTILEMNLCSANLYTRRSSPAALVASRLILFAALCLLAGELHQTQGVYRCLKQRRALCVFLLYAYMSCRAELDGIASKRILICLRLATYKRVGKGAPRASLVMPAL